MVTTLTHGSQGQIMRATQEEGVEMGPNLRSASVGQPPGRNWLSVVHLYIWEHSILTCM